jgi:hypothetical protein
MVGCVCRKWKRGSNGSLALSNQNCDPKAFRRPPLETGGSGLCTLEGNLLGRRLFNNLPGLVQQSIDQFLLRLSKRGIAGQFLQFRPGSWNLTKPEKALYHREIIPQLLRGIRKLGVQPGPLDFDAEILRAWVNRRWGLSTCGEAEQQRNH